MTIKQRITPFLWFDGRAEEAAEFYVSVFPNSRIDELMKSSVDTPGAEVGSVIVVDFTLDGQRYQAMNGGPHDSFNDAISLVVHCEDQAEIDCYWAALTADGGAPVQCGWLKDKFGVSWQVVPEAFFDMVKDPDVEKAKRVMEAMMQMVKFDIAALKAAYDAAT